MNFTQQYIPCPNCKGSIPFDVRLLLEGHKFVCPYCNCSVSMEPNSQSIVEEAVKKYEKLMEKSKEISDPSFESK